MISDQKTQDARKTQDLFNSLNIQIINSKSTTQLSNMETGKARALLHGMFITSRLIYILLKSRALLYQILVLHNLYEKHLSQQNDSRNVNLKNFISVYHIRPIKCIIRSLLKKLWSLK